MMSRAIQLEGKKFSRQRKRPCRALTCIADSFCILVSTFPMGFEMKVGSEGPLFLFEESLGE